MLKTWGRAKGGATGGCCAVAPSYSSSPGSVLPLVVLLLRPVVVGSLRQLEPECRRAPVGAARPRPRGGGRGEMMRRISNEEDEAGVPHSRYQASHRSC